MTTKVGSINLYRYTHDIDFVCRRYHISKASLMRWNRIYDGTRDSLIPKSHRPHTPHPNTHLPSLCFRKKCSPAWGLHFLVDPRGVALVFCKAINHHRGRMPCKKLRSPLKTTHRVVFFTLRSTPLSLLRQKTQPRVGAAFFGFLIRNSYQCDQQRAAE